METLVSLEVLAPDVVVGVLVPLVLNASSDELPNGSYMQHNSRPPHTIHHIHDTRLSK